MRKATNGIFVFSAEFALFFGVTAAGVVDER